MKNAIIPALALVLSTLSSASMASDAGYLLGPDDELSIRVYDFRPKSGEAFAWQALTGDFAVGADGNVSIPILGPVKAAGSDATGFARRISEALKDKVGLTELPAASVEVKRHRPFFVVGAVRRPGKFEFQPGMDVLQALGTAEGLGAATDADGARREVAVARGEVRSLQSERTALEARGARLSAEIDGSPEPTYPADLTARRSDPRVARAMREETLLFEARRSGLRAELAAIDQSRVVLRQEIAALDSKGRSLDHQIDINKKQLGVVTDLLNKGMTDKPRQIAAEQAEAGFEAGKLDVDVASLKAQQDLSRADRDVVELNARFRREALEAAADTRARLDQNEERSRTASTLLAEAAARSPGGDEDDPAPSYELVRRGPGGPVTLAASEGDPMQPGDVLRVTVRRPVQPSRPDDAATADPIPAPAAAAIPARTASQAMPADQPAPAAQPPAPAAPVAAVQAAPRARTRPPAADGSAR